MDSKNKNILIGGLLAVVLVMAVGYAAFATNLNISGTATIDSSWNVRFDTTKTTANSVAKVTGQIKNAEGQTVDASSAPDGTIAYTPDKGDLEAVLTTTLHQPGDKVTYTLAVKNYGTIAAKGAAPTIKVSDGTTATDVITGTSKKINNIQYTVTYNPAASLAKDASDTITVEVLYDEPGDNAVIAADTKTSISIDLNYTQAS